MSREQIQRLALVVLVVLLAAVASQRLLAMVQPSCPIDPARTVHVRIHEAPLPPLPPRPPHAGAHAEVAAEARRMAEEARRIAEAHRQIARERAEVVVVQ